MLSPAASSGQPFGVRGVRIAHRTDAIARTGCTVVLFDEPVVASGEVRGGAPASRELALLEPTAGVERIDAVLLTGGSAFGLAAADGVMRWCEERGRGFPTAVGRVPIVPTMALFDLAVGDAGVRPTAEDGYRAAADAAAAPDDARVATGPVGAGAGARVHKWIDAAAAVDAGIGHAVMRQGRLVVVALVAVNAWGEIVRGVLPDHRTAPAGAFGTAPAAPAARPDEGTSTTIGVVVTNARLTKTQCRSMAVAGHAGMARAIYPAHTPADGDALVCAATGTLSAGPGEAAEAAEAADAQLMAVLALSDAAVAAAIRSVAR